MERYLKRKAPNDATNVGNSRQRQEDEDINWEQEVQFDPGKRKEIYTYHPNRREEVIRKYLDNGPCQPRTLEFPTTQIAGKNRRFNPEWFDEFGSWLEYSESKDRVYCFPCFLMRDRTKTKSGYQAFVVDGWNSWNKKDGLTNHVGDVGSPHNKALKDCDALLKRQQHIDVALHLQSEVAKNAYFVRLNGSIDAARVLLKQGLPFRGHDESKNSYNKGNFKELCDCLAEQNPTLAKVVGKNAAGNCLMQAPEIQKDIVECFASEILHSILEDIGHDVFCLLVDESIDVACKEQMAIVLRYVDSCGLVQESFVGLVHVKDTTSANLKSCIDSFFAKYKLSLKQLRGQGYDGASNMRGEFNGLQALIMRESNTAYCVHCFAHQLQLVVVAVVLAFLFYLHLMLTILLITNTLSIALQRKDQDIVNAINCVKATRSHLDELRRNGWEKVLGEVYAFCDKHDISKLEMGEAYIDPTKTRRKTGITNKHHYEVDCFNDVLDWLLQELDSRFNETNSQLLVCSAAFNPRDSFHDFNVDNLVSLAKLYPHDFNSGELRELSHHLRLYIADVKEDDRFSNLHSIGELSQKMVETRKHICYPLVYRLLKLVFVLPVATATVERCFSAMKIVKTFLRNRMGDEYLSNSVICNVEKEKIKQVTNKAVVRRFMAMGGHKY